MRSLRAVHLPLLVMFAALAVGCSGGDDTTQQPESPAPVGADGSVELDGVRFDVRRDPG